MQGGVICRVRDSQVRERTRSLSFYLIHKKSEARIVCAGGNELSKKGPPKPELPPYGENEFALTLSRLL